MELEGVKRVKTKLWKKEWKGDWEHLTEGDVGGSGCGLKRDGRVRSGDGREERKWKGSGSREVEVMWRGWI